MRFSNIDEPYYAARILCVRRILPDYTGGTVESLESLEGLIIDDECRIVLLPDGKWKFQRRHDRKANSKLERRIILQPDGTWNFATEPQRNAATTESAKNIVSAATERTVKTSVATNSSNPANNDSSPQYHKVKKGDNLYRIALSYNTTVNKLCELNNITSTATLSIGQKIRIE